MRFLVRCGRPRSPLARIFMGPPSPSKAVEDTALFGESSALFG